MDRKFIFKIYYITHLNEPIPIIKYIVNSPGNNTFEVSLNGCKNKKNLFWIEINHDSPFLQFKFIQLKSNNENNIEKYYRADRLGSYIIFENEIIFLGNSDAKNKKQIIFSDLDDTLLGDDIALKEFNRFWLENYYFDENTLLVYNTGRCMNQIKPIFSQCVLYPDFIIASTGSQIYFFDTNENSYKLDEEWNKIIYSNWNIIPVIEEFGKFKFLHRFEENKNDDPGICFLGNSKDIADNMEEIEKKIIHLRKNNNIKTKLLISGKGDQKFFELLSENAGKGNPIEYLCKKLDTPIENTVGFGDSLNDVEMFLKCGKSFMVENSQKDLAEWFELYLKEEKNVNNKKIIFSKYRNAWALLKELKSIL